MQDLAPRLSNINEPQYVWYADKPPRLGGIPRKISLAELYAKVGSDFFLLTIFILQNYYKLV